MVDPAPLFYSTAEDVISESGVKPEDFDLFDDPEPEEGGPEGQTASEKLVVKIEGWLKEATDLINQDRNRDYRTEEIVPPGIHRIARDLACNLVARSIFRRQNPIVRVGEFAIRLPDDTVFTKSIREELSRYPAYPKLSIMRIRRDNEVG